MLGVSRGWAPQQLGLDTGFFARCCGFQPSSSVGAASPSSSSAPRARNRLPQLDVGGSRDCRVHHEARTCLVRRGATLHPASEHAVRERFFFKGVLRPPEKEGVNSDKKINGGECVPACVATANPRGVPSFSRAARYLRRRAHRRTQQRAEHYTTQILESFYPQERSDCVCDAQRRKDDTRPLKGRPIWCGRS
jgi:hypothetical protein